MAHASCALCAAVLQPRFYEIEFMRHFAELRLERISDETTTPNFRHLLEQHDLG
ncbi:hypothetical protein BJB45_07920 [Halomonas huangheensis]|uniref:Uncharacterized protein n=1 Tax=Halomonas huangheensis TaxID=1178482 RepID=W1NDF4_9GAMM|nr:hypothetical protein BJB45_07920 [Halomonas huangheensis]